MNIDVFSSTFHSRNKWVRRILCFVFAGIETENSQVELTILKYLISETARARLPEKQREMDELEVSNGLSFHRTLFEKFAFQCFAELWFSVSQMAFSIGPLFKT